MVIKQSNKTLFKLFLSTIFLKKNKNNTQKSIDLQVTG